MLLSYFKLGSKGGARLVITIAVVVLLVIAAALLFVMTRPDEFRVQRSGLVNAPGDVVFAIINDLHQWERWSPYQKFDPQMKKSFEGSALGPGAIYTWSGNNKAGEGQLTIVESKPNEFVKMNLEFTRPFKCENQVTFAIVPDGAGTRVSWILDGKNNLMSKVFHLFMNMDTMIGKQFEEGLATLDTVAQSEVAKR